MLWNFKILLKKSLKKKMPMPMYLKNFSLRMSFYRSGPIKIFCDFVKDMAPQKRFLLQKVDFIQLWALKAGGGGGRKA